MSTFARTLRSATFKLKLHDGLFYCHKETLIIKAPQCVFFILHLKAKLFWKIAFYLQIFVIKSIRVLLLFMC